MRNHTGFPEIKLLTGVDLSIWMWGNDTQLRGDTSLDFEVVHRKKNIYIYIYLLTSKSLRVR